MCHHTQLLYIYVLESEDVTRILILYVQYQGQRELGIMSGS